MATNSISNATLTDFTNTVPNFIVESRSLDTANSDGETFVYFDRAPEFFGYYKTIPEIYSAANAVATWAFSKGYETEDSLTKEVLRHITGMGKDTFAKIAWNHEVTKLIVGDAFIQIVSVGDKIANLIPISPERVKVVIKNNRIIRYEIWNGKEWKKKQTNEIIHSHNKRIGDEIRGTSQIEASKWLIDARNEALDDERTIKHRDKALGIAYYKTDNAGKILYANQQIEKGVKNGEMIGVPEGTVDIKQYPSRSSEDRTGWIAYLENFFYQTFGVPRAIATSDGTSEVGGKMGHVIFEPIYTKEQTDFEDDLWTQAKIKVKFNRPPSLGGLMNEEEQKNTGQINIQPNDVTADLSRE